MKKGLHFVLSMEFWRMGLLLRTFNLFISYWNLFFAHTSTSSPPSFESKPVCVITGVSDTTFFIFSYELHRQLGVMDISRQVSVIAVDPGVVKTNMHHVRSSSMPIQSGFRSFETFLPLAVT